jgi:UDP-N-acetylmuramoyl-tripeptide--D-alanyl-D-alanine ligase
LKVAGIEIRSCHDNKGAFKEEMKLTVHEIARAVNGSALDEQGTIAPSGYSIDSRTIQPGECFIALRGKSQDGHRFIAEAVAKGASLIIAEEKTQFEAPPELPVILVPDSLQGLQQLARHARRKWGGPVVAITGSTGKTTTKEIASFLLSAGCRVFKSMGNFNNDYGLPLSVLKLSEWDKIAVLELGMSAAGEIARLASIAQPDIGVVTNVKPVHLEFFESLDDIAKAKRELIEALSAEGIAILNNDDVRVRKFGRFFQGQVITFGMKNVAAYRAAQAVFKGLEGCQFLLEHKGMSYPMECSLLGEHNVANCLPAIVLAHHFGLDFPRIAQQLRQLKPHPGRGEIVRFTQGFTVINDSYNSNPAALEAMLRLTGKIPGFERKILVAGEMLELGLESREFHDQAGKKAAQSGFDLILGIQGDAQQLVWAARMQGYKDEQARFFADSGEAARWLQQQVRPGDLILLKGSRGVKTERVLDLLKWHFT